MAGRDANDEGSKRVESSDNACSECFGRRGFLKAAGAATFTAATLGTMSDRGSAASYRTITVSAGEQRLIRVRGGETLENVLIDVTADGADAMIIASGDGWAIRNVGFKGRMDVGSNTNNFGKAISPRGDGVIENLYLGDGIEDGIRRSAWNTPPSHADHIDVRNCYVAEWSANAVYAAGPGRIREPGKTDGEGGTLAFQDCYFRDNNIAHLRIASGGTTVENCVFTNTGNVPPHPNTSAGESGVVNSRGIYTGYGDPNQVITVSNCDIDITSSNTNGGGSAVVSGTHGTYGELTTVRVEDSQVRGGLLGDQVEAVNLGSNPDTSVPDAVPQTAEEAASGTTSGDGSNDSGSSDESTETDGPQTLSIAGGSVSNRLTYAFEVSDEVTKSTAYGGTTSSEDVISGTSVEGLVAGGTDSFEVSGAVTSFNGDDGLDLTLDGQSVTADELVTEDGSSGDGTETDTPDDGTETDTPDDGTETDSPDDGSPTYDNVFVVDGTQNPDDNALYRFTVSGDVRRNESRSSVADGGLAWDDMKDEVTSGEVVGIVGNGVDAFDFSGQLTDVDIEGDAVFTIVRS